MGKYVESFIDLKVYRLQQEISKAVFHQSKHFPEEERKTLTEPFRRSIRLIGARIAEAWSYRQSTSKFSLLLSEADGFQSELMHWVHESFQCGYLEKADYLTLTGQAEELGCMIGMMIKKASTFASSKPHSAA